MDTQTANRIGLVALVSAIVALAFGYVINNDPGEEGAGDVLGFVIVSIVAIAVAALMFRVVIPRAREATQRDNAPAKRGLITSVIGFLSVAVFWLGLPYILAPAGVVLGLIGQERAAAQGRRGLATAAIIIGVIAYVLAIVAIVGDELD